MDDKTTVAINVGDKVRIRSLYPDMPDLYGNFRGRQCDEGEAVVVVDGIQFAVEWGRIAPLGKPVAG